MNRQDEGGGKVFTDVIRKTPVRAHIRTSELEIEGTIHVHPERRVSDELNGPEAFLAVTEAQVKGDQVRSSVPFMAVNKRHIILLIPDDGPAEVDRD